LERQLPNKYAESNVKQEVVMKFTFVFPILFLIALSLGCQPQTKCDAYATVAPGVRTIDTDFDRIVIVRLESGTDLLAGLQQAVEKENIKNAVVLSGIGSLTDYHVHTVANRAFPPESVFMKDSAPQDLLAVNGYVVDGRVHCHVTFTDEKRALGGHLEPETKAFTFAIVTLGVLKEPTDLKRIDDYIWH
jgi:hypothetical protein